MQEKQYVSHTETSSDWLRENGFIDSTTKKIQALRYYKKDMYMAFIHFINHGSVVVGT